MRDVFIKFKSLSNKSFFLERFVNLKHSSCYLSFLHKILENKCERIFVVALRNGTGKIKFLLSDILSFMNYLTNKILFYGTRVRSRHATTDLGPSYILYVCLISITLLHLSGKNSHSRLLRYPWNWFTGVIAARHFDLKNDRVVGVGLYVRLISLKRIDFSRLCFYI